MSSDPPTTVGSPVDEPDLDQPDDPAPEGPADRPVDDATVGAATRTSPEATDRDPFAAIHPYPGEAVPWPPTPDQRGLSSPYPPGGEDPDPDAARHEERFYLKLLLAMVLLIVVGGFAISLLALLLGFGGGS